MRTFWTGALDVAVGKKLLFDGIIELLARLLRERPFLEKVQKKRLGKLMVFSTRSAVIVVKINIQAPKCPLHFFVVTVHNSAWCGALLAGAQGDGCAMFVRTAHPHNIPFSGP